jgi:predicted outer membrane repeat protein
MRNLITCLSVCVLSGAALADTWTVDDDGKADFDNIQSAIDVASDGDEILVYPGIYTGTGANSNVIQYLNKNIAIESTNGAAVTIIDGENLRRAVQCFASGSLNGFTLTNGYHTGRGGGLSVGGPNSPTISNCLIEFNSSPDGGGVSVRNQSTPSFLNCTIVNNTANQGGGVYIVSPGVAAFMGCSIQDNTADYGGGIFNDATTITISGSTVCSNTPDQLNGSYQDGGGNCVSEICDSDSDGVYDCIDQCPGVDDIDSDGDGVMDCIDQCPGEDDIDSDGDGVMDCVDDCPDWPGACSSDGQTIYVIAGESIQAAIDVAPAGGVVSIEGGSWYAGSINPQGKAITIIGIDDEWGQKPHLTSDDGTSVLVCESGEISSTVFENLHIEGGDATYGGGMYNLQSSPTVRHCTFWQNSASVHGGAVYNVNSSATFEYCYFGNCSGGGNGNGGAMSNGYESSVTLLNCIFEENQSHDGGAIANDDKSFVTATNCEFRWNGASGNGGAVLCVVQGGSGIWVHSTFENCIFEENQAENGGGIFADTMSTNETNLELLNCTFTGNIATASGGGVRIEIGSLVATDCIFTNNSAAVSGGGMKIVYDHGTILTSVLVCGNSPDQIDSAGHQDGGGNCVSEICDSDSDGVYDCIDQCPGVDDIDSDGDGVMDCIDQCPNDPNKVYPDVCGCGVPDEDVDENGIIDCLEPDCVTDLDADGDVDVADLLTLIAAWGTCDGCSADFDGDNDVDVADLLTLIAAWGACP